MSAKPAKPSRTAGGGGKKSQPRCAAGSCDVHMADNCPEACGRRGLVKYGGACCALHKMKIERKRAELDAEVDVVDVLRHRYCSARSLLTAVALHAAGELEAWFEGIRPAAYTSGLHDSFGEGEWPPPAFALWEADEHSDAEREAISDAVQRLSFGNELPDLDGCSELATDDALALKTAIREAWPTDVPDDPPAA